MPKQILCISLSEISRDARVLRQIGLLAELGEVTTIGFGSKPPGVKAHVEVPAGLKTLPQTVTGVLKLAVRAHRAAECSSPAAAWVLTQQLDGAWDLVVANEARVLDLAPRLAGGAPIWVDLHEWAPGERTHIPSWRILVAPFMTYLCRKYLPDVALSTTVSKGIVELYQANFSITPLFMPNAGPFRDTPVEEGVGDVIRCVHSGAAIRGRALETLVQVFKDLPERFTLDLYLVPGGDGGSHLRELKGLAMGNSRINFRDPVGAQELPATLSQYDLGVHWIPAEINLNNRFALPNKFFDYVQARIGIGIGPSVEMKREVDKYGLGAVATSFEQQDLAASLHSLTRDDINRFKRNADLAARELSFEANSIPVKKAVEELLSRNDADTLYS